MYRLLTIQILLLILLISCQSKQENQAEQSNNTIIKKQDLFAWCIVPYDSMKRSPQDRMEMLKSLGLNKYAYDWRTKHLPEMATEMKLAKENDIEVIAVWLWIDANQDQPGQLSEHNQKVIETIEAAGMSTQFWLGFHTNNFEGKSDSAKISRSVEMIAYIDDRAKHSNSKVALYNHGGWIGEPENQVKVIGALQREVGIIYNFHHGHHHIDNFETVINTIKPHLWAVNLNGMEENGPKIHYIGHGDHEKAMLQTVLDAGFNGPFGILGHVEKADVKEVLMKNMEGLQNVLDELK